MGVGGGVENLPAAALGTDHAGAAQQPKMMADQRLRSPDRLGDLADISRIIVAGNGDTAPGRVAEQMKDLGDLDDVVIVHRIII